MKQIKTLTVNGNTYEIADPDAARIDDHAVGENAWSSRKIVDRLCPAFTESGSAVTCRPVEGYPLEVVSKIEHIQEGSGEASPDNVRPIIGHSAVKLTRNGEEFTIALGQEVYGGSFDWTSGVLTITHGLVTLTPDMGWVMTGSSNPNGIRSFYTNKKVENAYVQTNNVVSSHYPVRKEGWSISSVPHPYAIKILNSVIYIADVRFTDLDSFLAFLEEETVQLRYPLKEPVTVQFAPQEILALSGENTLHSDTGDTTVTGKADPAAVIEKLTNAIIALGGNV